MLGLFSHHERLSSGVVLQVEDDAPSTSATFSQSPSHRPASPFWSAQQPTLNPNAANLSTVSSSSSSSSSTSSFSSHVQNTPLIQHSISDPSFPSYRDQSPLNVLPFSQSTQIPATQQHKLVRSLASSEEFYSRDALSVSLSDSGNTLAGALELDQQSAPVKWHRDAFHLGLVIFFLYLSSSLSNNLSKHILRDFHHPMTLTMLQFLFLGAFSLLIMRGLKLHPFQVISRHKFIQLVLPLGIGHIIGHLLTAISLDHVAVSFVHTIKATSPVFSVLVSALVLGEKFTSRVLLSLIPIVCGVILCTATELEFDAIGFFCAFGSTITFVLQNTYSKKLFRDKGVDHINLLFYTSVCSFCLLFPFWLLVDASWIWDLEPLLPESSSLSNTGLLWLFLFAGFCHFIQNLMAFTALSQISPLTYSVANVFKRVFVISSSFLWFGNSVTLSNIVGISMAVGGVALYNRARFQQKKREAEPLARISRV